MTKPKHEIPCGSADAVNLEEINRQRAAEGLPDLGLWHGDLQDLADTTGLPMPEAQTLFDEINRAIERHLSHRQIEEAFGDLGTARKKLGQVAKAAAKLQDLLEELPPRARDWLPRQAPIPFSVDDAIEVITGSIAVAQAASQEVSSSRQPEMVRDLFAADIARALLRAGITLSTTRKGVFASDGIFADVLRLALEASGETPPDNIFPIMKRALDSISHP